MEIGHIIPHIEALVFASERPLTAIDITELINNAFGFMEDKISMEQVATALDGIIEKYQAEFYPFELRESGGGWQFLTKKEYHKTIAQLNGEKYLKRLSNAALETLAIIAYKQPVTKADMEAIRGVSCDYSIQKLLEKELIVITGRDENLPGKPLIYATSKNFMDYFGLNSVEDLPKLKEIFDESIDPTRTNISSLPEDNTEERVEQVLAMERTDSTTEPVEEHSPAVEPEANAEETGTPEANTETDTSEPDTMEDAEAEEIIMTDSDNAVDDTELTEVEPELPADDMNPDIDPEAIPDDQPKTAAAREKDQEN